MERMDQKKNTNVHLETMAATQNKSEESDEVRYA